MSGFSSRSKYDKCAEVQELRQRTAPMNSVMDINRYVNDSNFSSNSGPGSVGFGIRPINVESSLWQLDKTSSNCNVDQYPFCSGSGCFVGGTKGYKPPYLEERGDDEKAVSRTNISKPEVQARAGGIQQGELETEPEYFEDADTEYFEDADSDAEYFEDADSDAEYFEDADADANVEYMHNLKGRGFYANNNQSMGNLQLERLYSNPQMSRFSPDQMIEFLRNSRNIRRVIRKLSPEELQQLLQRIDYLSQFNGIPVLSGPVHGMIVRRYHKLSRGPSHQRRRSSRSRSPGRMRRRDPRDPRDPRGPRAPLAGPVKVVPPMIAPVSQAQPIKRPVVPMMGPPNVRKPLMGAPAPAGARPLPPIGVKPAPVIASSTALKSQPAAAPTAIAASGSSSSRPPKVEYLSFVDDAPMEIAPLRQQKLVNTYGSIQGMPGMIMGTSDMANMQSYHHSNYYNRHYHGNNFAPYVGDGPVPSTRRQAQALYQQTGSRVI